MTPEERARITEGAQVRALPARLVTRAEGTDAREIEGIGVPYNQPTELWPGIREQFAPGAVADDAQVMLFYRHDEPIGRVIEHHNAPEGWMVDRATISETSTGNDAYTLAKDDVIRSLSVGFYPREWTETHDTETGEVLITHTAVDVREVSLVPIPAYDGAALTSVRHRQTAPAPTPTAKDEEMTDEQRAALETQLAEVRAGQEDLARRVEIGLAGSGTEQREVAALAQFASFGEYVRAAAAGDERAQRAMAEAVNGLLGRAYEGGTTANVDIPSNSWVGDVIDLGETRQPVANTFQHTYDLPAEGMKVDYGVLKSNTLTVDKQESEGADLPYGEVAVGHESADIDTYGGYSKLTRQEIERMPVNMVDLTFRGLAINYHNRIEALARSVFRAAHTRALASANNTVNLGAALGDASATEWLALVLDLAEKFDANGHALNGIKVSRATFLALASVQSTDRMLVVGNAPAGSGAAGTLDITVPEANLYGVNVELVPNWTGANLAAYDRLAIRTQESPGAPFRLQDGNIINLTEAFSVYGYAASYQQLADGIVAADLTGGILPAGGEA